MTERFPQSGTDCDNSLSEGTAKAAWRKTIRKRQDVTERFRPNDSVGMDKARSKLYEQGKLSLGQATELVGMTKRTFAELLGRYDVSVFNYPASELSRDVKNA